MTADIRLGTSSFTAAGWQGAFYPVRKQADYLSFYSTRFDTVEVDSTFYAILTIVPIRQSQHHWRAVDQPVWQPLIISARKPKRIGLILAASHSPGGSMPLHSLVTTVTGVTPMIAAKFICDDCDDRDGRIRDMRTPQRILENNHHWGKTPTV